MLQQMRNRTRTGKTMRHLQFYQEAEWIDHDPATASHTRTLQDRTIGCRLPVVPNHCFIVSGKQGQSLYSARFVLQFSLARNAASARYGVLENVKMEKALRQHWSRLKSGPLCTIPHRMH